MKSKPIDTAVLRFLVASDPQPVLNRTNGQQKADKDGQPLFTVDLLVSRENFKAEVITVKVAGARPNVTEGQRAKLPDLEAYSWEMKDEDGETLRGTSYTASKVEPANSAKAA